jgi:hypothetical protein
MALPQPIGRAAPFLAAGAAAAWYLRGRRGPQQASEGLERHVSAVERVSDAADVTSVIEDLLALAPGEPAGAGRGRRLH